MQFPDTGPISSGIGALSDFKSSKTISCTQGTDAEQANARAQAIAWISILCGATSGMIMGLWSFDGPLQPPAWIGDYDELPRRLLRLAHIAFFALGVLHIMIAKRLSTSEMPLRRMKIAYVSIAIGNILMPLVLIGAALFEPIKYLSALPATSLTIAFLLVAHDAVRSASRITQ